MNRRIFAGAAFLTLLAVVLIYANHFGNAFHFDDYHAVCDNPYIQNPANIPRFFADARTFSTLPDHHMYRPLLSASLALDYWLAGGLTNLFYFHLSTFILFLIQLVLMYFMFLGVMNKARPRPGNRVIALWAAAWYGLHPVSAETVNYIVQRADLHSTLAVVASICVYQYFPGTRRLGLYLLPAAVGAFSKPPAIMFAPLFFLYLLFFEEQSSLPALFTNFGLLRRVLVKSLPAVLLCLALYILQSVMTPATFDPGGASLPRYVMTQPFVAFHYFKSFFLPLDLNADAGWKTFDVPWRDEVLLGLLFVLAMLWLAWHWSRSHAMRPVSFGILWFFIALVPTSFVPLAEPMNDHRMFFAFVGLALAVCWLSAEKLLYAASHPVVRRAGAAAIAAAVLLLPLYAYGTWQRNKVWRDEESLWRDVVTKSPAHGRGLMNFGLTQMAKGRMTTALHYFERAHQYTPNYYVLEINLGIVKSALNRKPEAELHFQRAISLAPGQSEAKFYYGRWLKEQGRMDEAAKVLQTGIAANPLDFRSRHMLMEIYAARGANAELRTLAEQTLRLLPGDSASERHLNPGQTGKE